jgi:2-polyprenyl-3-methyl-5-hydroxy-6-metoxy-1,4-benzoquinol methylase
MDYDTVTNCPNCNGDSSSLFKTKDYNRKITNNFFSYKRCNKCNLIFLSHIPNNLGDYYKEDYYEIPSKQKLIKTANKIEYQVEIIKNYVLNGKLLDIGAAFGVFAYKAKISGYDVSAIEMSELCCKYLTDKVGIKVYQSSKPESILPTLDGYDVITFWHNIEHLVEPWRVLEEAAKKVNPKGVILIATPNPDSFAFRFLGRFWPHIDAPRHVQLIPEFLLTAKMKSLGFDLVMKTTNDKGGRSWNRFSWQRIVINQFSSKTMHRVGFVIGWLFSIPLSLIENRNYNGSAYTVIYKKSQDFFS